MIHVKLVMFPTPPARCVIAAITVMDVIRMTDAIWGMKIARFVTGAMFATGARAQTDA